ADRVHRKRAAPGDDGGRDEERRGHDRGELTTTLAKARPLVDRRTWTSSARARKSCCLGWILLRAGGLSGHVALAQLLDPFRVVAKRPLFAYPAARDRAERVSSAGMDQGEVEVAQQE